MVGEATAAQVNHVERLVRDLISTTNSIGVDIGTVKNEQNDMRQRIESLQRDFEVFVNSDRQAKALQLAEMRIVKVRQELETSYGHYGQVRRSATGILQAFDSGLVTDESVRSLSEELMIASPRYWLAPVLVSVAAWSRDERALADKGMTEAYRRDPDKTALFFVLMLRRYGRMNASAAWLEQYLLRQDPGRLRREFVVVLEGVANGGFGFAAKTVIAEHTERWLQGFAQSPEFSGQQQSRWATEFGLLSQPIPTTRFPTLAVVSPDWSKLQTSLSRVSTNRAIGDHFTSVFSGELHVPPSIEAQIDDLLTTLVSEFDTEELPLRKEESKLQSIIDANGDEAKATVDFANTEAALEKEIDFAGLLTNAAMHPAEAGVSRGTQRLAVALSKDWVLGGFDSFTVDARNSVPTSVGLKIDNWSGTLTGPTDADDLAASVSAHVDKETEAQVAAIKFGGPHLAAAVIGALVLLFGLIKLQPVLIVLALAGGVYAYFGYKGLDKKRDLARRAGEARKVAAVEQVRNASSELVDYRIAWQKEDDVAEMVREQIAVINPAEHQFTRPDEARGTLR